ncbi:putative cryptochrome [Apodospora peruviana]|uniref:Cryptochrome DASH n=1 Tax=Apodospora peruviana TaxID=516989 RepID=A0AAE0MFS8_9PEZI|nr:putative cryptochrome [Apodospora peruviana]
MAQPSSVVIHLLRRDLRVGDNPILHHLGSSSSHGFTHCLPLYILTPNQIEVSGFILGDAKSPYPEARSAVGSYLRCGPHRARFLGEAVWNVKESLEALGSGLLIRVGMFKDVVRDLIDGLTAQNHKVGAVWMVSHEGVEENRDEKSVSAICEKEGIDFKLWTDEKYLIDDRDLSIANNQELPDVFTTYRKSAEPLREKPRAVLPPPEKGTLPPFPEISAIPAQAPPFTIPDSLDALLEVLLQPVQNFLPNLPQFPKSAVSAHPFKGGETAAYERLKHLIQSEGMKNYKDTRNGLIGTEFSTKLSAYLAQGCVTSRQIHHALLGYENGTDSAFKNVDGYGAGENEGTAAIRFELLWRDYMRLCHQKYGAKLFHLKGFKADDAQYNEGENKPKWKFPTKELAAADQNPSPERIAEVLARFTAGTTGMGLIDASQRELLHTGYTSNRARQNVASFLAKHLGIDWRHGAEWYEMLLVDYDVSSNWANWQYVSGVGNDPRGELRIFNPVKQAFDYDKSGDYVRSWVPEVSKLEKLENVFQACTASAEDVKAAGLEGNIMVTDPVKRIEFTVEGKPSKPNKRAFFRRKAQQARGGRSGGTDPDSPISSEGQHGDGIDDGKPQNQTQAGSSGQAASGDGSEKPAGQQGSDRAQPRGYYHGNDRSQSRGYHHGSGSGSDRGAAGLGRGRGGRYALPHAGQGRGHWEQPPRLQPDA